MLRKNGFLTHEYEVFTPHIERRVLKILPLEGRGVHNTDRRDKQNMGSLAGGGESKGFILVSHLHDAAECGDTTLARHLLEEGIDVRSSYDDGVTALHLASCKGHVSFVDLLLKSRCPPDIGTSIGLTPLHYAAAQGHTKVIEMLVSAGAHVNASCAKGRTPLFVAAENGTLESVKTLLKAGSQVNCASDLGMTPLSTASLHSHEEVVRVLLQHGASVNIADRHNNLPLHCAVP
ncbi:ankyrin repeat, PH and SEC7 domain containing protein secG-like isoform X2 [Pomacea canaliculata]|uniref:ankyrin repeat, PH and SEC7 domain containing protein secG-like isoform X2 n=1 Tax=Pomacea canaliculata TaxID=400727 RepID=UPI000D73A1C3|nr:ankyrin repeat, PH and SEC7 domain containing protein secG-like isoform X2 [Pomacea canaliculata]